jgi:hypothetical protein
MISRSQFAVPDRPHNHRDILKVSFHVLMNCLITGHSHNDDMGCCPVFSFRCRDLSEIEDQFASKVVDGFFHRARKLRSEIFLKKVCRFS